jgi:predicted lipid-binding transport protein (Tim44 family)
LVMPDSQTLGLLVAAMVAGIICFRLYTVLGRRTGHEPPPQQPVPQSRPAALPQPAPDLAPSSSGLLDIQLADREFESPKFLAGAREAYARIVTAFAKGDRAELKPLSMPVSPAEPNRPPLW